jgi:hypothetical protein
MLATILVVLHAVGTWSFTTLGLAGAIASVTLVAAASVVCARMAAWGAGKDAWFVIPTLLFTVAPLAARIWGLSTFESGGWMGALDFVPFLAGFAVPVLLLLVVYRALSVRSRIA